MNDAFICDAIRTPIGRYGGAMKDVRADDLGAVPINALIERQYGVDSMPETAENVAVEFSISRADQDAFALSSQQKAARAQRDGTLAQEIVGVEIAQKKGDPIRVMLDEHPRETSLESL